MVAYLHEAAGVPDEPEEINAEVVRRMLAAYRAHLPLIDGALDAVRRLSTRYPLGLASSSNRALIDAVLELAGLSTLLRRDRVLGGGRARQARAGRLPRSSARLDADAERMRRGRGLARRHPRSEGGTDARDRLSQPVVSAGRRRHSSSRTSSSARSTSSRPS